MGEGCSLGWRPLRAGGVAEGGGGKHGPWKEKGTPGRVPSLAKGLVPGGNLAVRPRPEIGGDEGLSLGETVTPGPIPLLSRQQVTWARHQLL